MLATYKAILRGDRLEWSGESPTTALQDTGVAVYVTILDEPANTASDMTRGKRMAAALEQLAAMNGLADLSDPAAWERGIRQDRSLPDRNLDADR